MTISWLTAANNNGGVVLVMNKARHSAENISKSHLFTLSVASSEHKALLVRAGKTSGRTVDKFSVIEGLDVDSTPWSMDTETESDEKGKKANVFACFEDESDDDDDNDDDNDDSDAGRSGREVAANTKRGDGVRQPVFPSPIAGSVAQLRCRVKSICDSACDASHHIIMAQVEAARVRRNYWDGKLFRPIAIRGVDSPPPPAILTFLGSQTFGEVQADETKVQIQK